MTGIGGPSVIGKGLDEASALLGLLGAVVAWGAKRLQPPEPKELIIAAMRDDVIRNVGGRDLGRIEGLAHLTEGLLGELSLRLVTPTRQLIPTPIIGLGAGAIILASLKLARWVRAHD